MTEKPKKPENYVRDQVIIILIALIIMVLMYFTENHFIAVFVPIWVYVLLSGFWFKHYNAQVRVYSEQVAKQNSLAKEAERIESLKGSSVNKNIARYRAIQKEKRASAPWWQFWV